MPPRHREFIAAVDKEVEKVERFYLERESELQARAAMIKKQAQELDAHRADWLVRAFLKFAPKELLSPHVISGTRTPHWPRRNSACNVIISRQKETACCVDTCYQSTHETA